MRKYGFIIIAILMTSIGLSTAQDESTCPVLVQTAIDSVATLCSGTGRNQVCYGNVQVTAAFNNTFTNTTFSVPGDIANLVDIATIQLSSMDTEANEWGVALMRVQANLPDTLPGQNVTFVLFGDVEVETVPAPPELFATVSVSGTVNIRSGPGTSYNVVDVVASGTALVANGRNDSADWLRVTLPDTEASGWVAASLLRPDGDTDSLAVVQPDTPIYGTMQAFYLRSGVGDARCAEAPNSGLLIQTPQGAGEIEFSINEVQIRMGSTVFLQAESGNQMTVYVLEGQAQVAAFDEIQVVPAGAKTNVPIDSNLAATGPPQEPEPYDTDDVMAVPTILLAPEIEIAEPAATESIVAANTCIITAAETTPLQTGPGLGFPSIDTLAADAQSQPIAQTTLVNGTHWWQLNATEWIQAGAVTPDGECANVPVVEAPSAPVINLSDYTEITGSGAIFNVNDCVGGIQLVPSGASIEVIDSIGGRGDSFTSLEQARNLSFSGQLTINDQVYSISRTGAFGDGIGFHHTHHYDIGVLSDGTYLVTGLMGGQVARCVMVVG